VEETHFTPLAEKVDNLVKEESHRGGKKNRKRDCSVFGKKLGDGSPGTHLWFRKRWHCQTCLGYSKNGGGKNKLWGRSKLLRGRSVRAAELKGGGAREETREIQPAKKVFKGGPKRQTPRYLTFHLTKVPGKMDPSIKKITTQQPPLHNYATRWKKNK